MDMKVCRREARAQDEVGGGVVKTLYGHGGVGRGVDQQKSSNAV